MQLELPQCPVCTSAITTTVKVVASSYCGHIICSDCAAICFPPKRAGSCPVCRTASISDGLLNLYVGFGDHELDGNLSVTQEDGPHSHPQAAPQMSLSRQSRAKEIVARLRYTVQDTATILAGDGHLEGSMAFVQAGCLLRRIADAMGEGTQRDIIYDVGDILMSIRDVYDRSLDLVKQNKRLEEQLRSADALSKTNRSDVEETARRHQLKFNRLKSEKEEREKELMQRIQITKDEYRNEVELHTRAESKLAALETEVAKLKKKAMRDGKKYLLVKQELESHSTAPSSSKLKSRHQHREPHVGSDASLLVEEPCLKESLDVVDLDEDLHDVEEEFPPSSAPTASSAASSSAPSQSSIVSSGSQKYKGPRFKASRRQSKDDVLVHNDVVVHPDLILDAPGPSKKIKITSSRGQKPSSIRVTNTIPTMKVPSSRREKGRDPLQASPKKKPRLFVGGADAFSSFDA